MPNGSNPSRSATPDTTRSASGTGSGRTSSAVTALKIAYLDDSGWKDTWDGAEAKATPRAVRISVATSLNGRTEELPPITVSLRIAPPQ